MGLATARLLASRGAIISLADLNEEGLKAAVSSLPTPEPHMYTTIDARKSESVNAWIESTIQKLGKLDGAVNMAGIITAGCPITEMTDESWNFNFDVNARGVFFCLRAQLKAMQNGGSIVNAASVFGQIGVAENAGYCSSKAAVIGLSRTAARENPHLRVNCVAPGKKVLSYHDCKHIIL